jgi:hypothetical protein
MAAFAASSARSAAELEEAGLAGLAAAWFWALAGIGGKQNAARRAADAAVK